MSAIGLTQNATPGSLNATAGNLVVAIRNDMDRLADFITWFNTLQLADIETLFGLSAADAATMQATIGNHGTLLALYNGTATLAAALNFRANGAPLWGGQ
jgi:hypothetical protein